MRPSRPIHQPDQQCPNCKRQAVYAHDATIGAALVGIKPTYECMNCRETWGCSRRVLPDPKPTRSKR